jgi:fatty acid desaturase
MVDLVQEATPDFKGAAKEMRADPAVRALAKQPEFAIPTLLMFSGSVVILGVSWWTVLNDLNWPVATILLHTVLSYMFFTVMHDAAHGSVARNLLVNDIIGSIAAWLMAPGNNVVAYRWQHMQHHKNLGDKEKDTDIFVFDGPRWRHPLNWLFGDVRALRAYSKALKDRPKRDRYFLWAGVGALIVVTAAFIATGHVVDLLLYMVLPSRLALFVFTFLFAYVPHMPGGMVEAEVGPFKASRTFIGLEWLMTPIFLFQNYHIIHHVLPHAPFYRMGRIWRLKEDFMLANGANVTYLGGAGKRRRDAPIGALPAEGNPYAGRAAAPQEKAKRA